jgi:adenosylcobyric acid synthase
LSRVTGRHLASGEDIAGYEIHIGRTAGPDGGRPFARIDGRNEGAQSEDGRIAGTYLHGMFLSDGFRVAYLAGLGVTASRRSHSAEVEATLDLLADHLEAHLDVPGLLALAR